MKQPKPNVFGAVLSKGATKLPLLPLIAEAIELLPSTEVTSSIPASPDMMKAAKAFSEAGIFEIPVLVATTTSESPNERYMSFVMVSGLPFVEAGWSIAMALERTAKLCASFKV